MGFWGDWIAWIWGLESELALFRVDIGASNDQSYYTN